MIRYADAKLKVKQNLQLRKLRDSSPSLNDYKVCKKNKNKVSANKNKSLSSTLPGNALLGK
jgi:hypothetical protein